MRALAAVVVLLALALLAGCADEDALALRDWTFEGPEGARAALTLPTHVEDRLPHARARYALRRAQALDPTLRGRELVLVFPRFLAHASLRVNGAKAESLDGPDSPGYRSNGPHAWRIPANVTASGALDLELDVEHTWEQSAWLDTVPRLTTALDGGTSLLLQRAFNDVSTYAAFGFTLFAGYLYLVVYVTDRRRTTFGWFALTGLSGFLYALFQSGLAQRFLGPWETSAAGLGVSTAVVAQLHFTHSYFGLPPPARAWDVAWAVASMAIIISTDYFIGTRVGGIATIALAVPAILAQVALFLRLVRVRPQPVNLYYVMGGWVLIAVLGIPDFNAWLGLGELLGGTRTGCFGIAIIGLLQTAAVSREHTLSLRRSDELAEERAERIRLLEARNRDVEVLNDELRRQVGARSRELAEAISRMTGTPGERTLLSGDVVEDRYEVIRLLGTGAAGNVYLVKRRTDGVELAMKVVKGASNRHALTRLAREAQLAAQVKHENVINCVDVDVASSGFLYIVMEYVAGDSLREHQELYGSVPWALDVLRQVAAGLASVHAHGIVHRDLKPANVLLVPREGMTPLVKIADFGVAGLARAQEEEENLAATIRSRPPKAEANALETEDELRLTQTGALLGTPLYMAPETIAGAKDAAPSVDVFSFGVMAYELLSGVPPFADSPALAQLRGLQVASPPSLASTHPDVPATVSLLVDRCLAFEAEERPTAREALAILTR